MKTNLPPELRQMLPLTPAVFFVLFSLVDSEKHGYAIMQDTTAFSNGEFRMGPGTLYTTLQRLLDLGLIAEIAMTGRSVERDSRRRYYKLSRLGKLLLEADLSRMSTVIELARRKKLATRMAE
jgi:DNA-binding PadR family transcriptional regulator